MHRGSPPERGVRAPHGIIRGRPRFNTVSEPTVRGKPRFNTVQHGSEPEFTSRNESRSLSTVLNGVAPWPQIPDAPWVASGTRGRAPHRIIRGQATVLHGFAAHGSGENHGSTRSNTVSEPEFTSRDEMKVAFNRVERCCPVASDTVGTVVASGTRVRAPHRIIRGRPRCNTVSEPRRDRLTRWSSGFNRVEGCCTVALNQRGTVVRSPPRRAFRRPTNESSAASHGSPPLTCCSLETQDPCCAVLHRGFLTCCTVA
jgi:hypothetical protein